MRKNENHLAWRKILHLVGILSLVCILCCTPGCKTAEGGNGPKKANPFSSREKKLSAIDEEINTLLVNADQATRAGKPHDARKAYEKALDIYEANKGKTSFRPTPELYCRMGMNVESFGQYELALDYYNQAIQLDPKDPMPYNSLGYCYMSQRQMDKAIANFQKAIELDPLEEKYNNNLGLAYGIQRDYDRAFECFRRVSTEADAYYNMSAIFAMNGEDKEAKMVLERAVELNPDHREAKRMLTAYSEYEQNPEEFSKPHLSGSYPGSSIPYQEAPAAGQVGSAAPSTPSTSGTSSVSSAPSHQGK
ncbi:MAG: tetratricopeptide repeat protein [Planctomycetia bacterium]|nr:tetratricopeptide repeat protein [Planctomycetia bacterium]